MLRLRLSLTSLSLLVAGGTCASSAEDAPPLGPSGGIGPDAVDDDDDDDDDDNDGEGDDDDAHERLDEGTHSDDESGGAEEKQGFIWIANAMQGTVSKINTRTMIEQGRYLTRADGLGDPSRTSVGVGGNVAVGNRSGGITKIFADPDHCDDKNGNGQIDTSQGASFLTWDEEECVAWYTPMNYQSQRTVAWTFEHSGNGDDNSFRERLWVTGVNEGDTKIDVMLLDGATGEVLQQSSVEVGDSLTPVTAYPFGAYGGAVDAENNLWFSNLGPGWLVRVSYADLSTKVWNKAYDSYGVTVDGESQVWVCGHGTARFTAAGETWTQAPLDTSTYGFPGGCMADGEGRLWLDVSDDTFAEFWMAAIDIVTLDMVKKIKIPSHAHGVSIDFDGNVWAVAHSDDNRAFRIDPTSEERDTYEGLTGPYTYSDMTGFALFNVVPDPPP